MTDSDNFKTVLQYHKDFKQWLNDTYGFGISMVGDFNFMLIPYIIKAMQMEIGSSVTGHWSEEDEKLYIPVEINENSAYNKVRLIQALLSYKGYWASEINGIFDESLKNQVIEFQRENNLIYDGIVKPSTFSVLITKFGVRKGRLLNESCREKETGEETSQGGVE